MRGSPGSSASSLGLTRVHVAHRSLRLPRPSSPLLLHPVSRSHTPSFHIRPPSPAPPKTTMYRSRHSDALWPRLAVKDAPRVRTFTHFESRRTCTSSKCVKRLLSGRASPPPITHSSPRTAVAECEQRAVGASVDAIGTATRALMRERRRRARRSLGTRVYSLATSTVATLSLPSPLDEYS